MTLFEENQNIRL
jgi:hypothetical protein